MIHDAREWLLRKLGLAAYHVSQKVGDAFVTWYEQRRRSAEAVAAIGPDDDEGGWWCRLLLGRR